ncbi:replication protein A 70 kDa DNA-binding subunit isoform X2 [Eleutherodactylus coqui]|uniref:replication protein A 70 kDa DNA-binding subunit isoform X2 n=1 Tax=Eleutherodactylus coqui TaxID=57060 RepID=UPI00346375EC
MALPKLSEGAIAAILKGDESSKPILQVLNVYPMTTGTVGPRYRLLMSDGLNTLQSVILASQLNTLIDNKELATNCICQISRYIVNNLKDKRRVIVVMGLDVLKPADSVYGKIGNPQPYTDGQAAPKPAAAAPTPPPPSKPAQSSAPPSSMNKGLSKPFGRAGALNTTPGGSQSKVVPIASLNPYQSKWTIRARVTNKGQIRTWSNSRGEGKLFSIEMVDESGEIRATAFNEQADKFFSLIEMNKVYYFSKGTLKIANKQYTAVKNDYEMTFNSETTVIPCDDSSDVPMVQFDFVPISELENKNKDTLLDIIGVCKSFEEVAKVTIKSNNREVSKRTIHLMDTSGKIVSTTLWGEDADKFDGSRQPVVAIKGARLSDFGGRSLSVLSSSTVMINPDIPEAFKLRGWFDSEGQVLEGSSISESRGGAGGANTNWKSLLEAKNENLGHGEKADYFTSVATIVFLRKENCLYKACPSQDCNKKVIDHQNGLFRCEKCNEEFPNFKYRLILSANISDFGENQWITCFQESAEAILGQNAAYLGELKEKNEQAFDEVFQNANFRSYVFRVRVKLETYNDESRIKATAMDVKPVDYKEYSKRLITNIRKLASQGA